MSIKTRLSDLAIWLKMTNAIGSGWLPQGMIGAYIGIALYDYNITKALLAFLALCVFGWVAVHVGLQRRESRIFTENTQQYTVSRFNAIDNKLAEIEKKLEAIG